MTRLTRSPGRIAALIVPVLLLAGCALPQRSPSPGEALRVLVYNIHAGKDAAGVRNLEQVAGLVRETRADLVLLQEVDRNTERSGREDQLATLARLTGLRGAFGRTLDYQGGEYGIAVLSRWPIVSDSVRPLRVTPEQERAGGSREPRGALHAVVDAPGGRIHLVNTHLDASREERYRLQEVEQVHALAEALRGAGLPVLVGGDLNATPESGTIGRLRAGGWRDAWTECGTGPEQTFPADRPVKRIDYLFLAPSLRCDSAAVLETTASDHRPVLVVVTLRDRSQP